MKVTYSRCVPKKALYYLQMERRCSYEVFILKLLVSCYDFVAVVF